MRFGVGKKMRSGVGGKMRFGVIGGVISLLFIAGIFTTFTTVDEGETALLTKFGQVKNPDVGKGLQFVTGVGYEYVKYTTRTKKMEFTNEADPANRDKDVILTSGITIMTDKNLPVPIDVTILYKVDPSAVAGMYSSLGRDGSWEQKLVMPEVSSTVRKVIGQIDIYALNTKREVFEESILLETNRVLNPAGVRVEQVKIRKIYLPPEITKAVLDKEKAKEEAEKTKYLVEKAKQEAQIEIEKQKGIAEANKVLNGSITKQLLEFKQVEVQLQELKVLEQKWNGQLPQTFVSGQKESSLLIGIQ